MQSPAPQSRFHRRSPLGPPPDPTSNRFLRPRSTRQPLGLRGDVRLGLIIGMLTDHGFLDVRGGLMVRFNKAGQQAHGMSATWAEKAIDRHLQRFGYGEHPAGKLAVPMKRDSGPTMRTAAGTHLLRHAVSTQQKIHLYSDVPMHYDRNGNSHWGIGRRRRPNLNVFLFAYSGLRAPPIMIVVSTL